MRDPLPAVHRFWTNRPRMPENKPLLMVLAWLACAVAFAGARRAAGDTVEFHAGDLPRPIPEVALTTNSCLVAGVWGTVDDVDLFLDLTHEDVGDLDVFLIKDGRQVQLFNQHGPGTPNLRSIRFDDEAAQPINAAPGPFPPGSYQPTSSPEPGASRYLGLFDGVSAAGTWQLRVVDDWPDSEVGELLAWGITVSVTPFPGDANLDGRVDSRDASILASHWLQSSDALWGDGDFNNDASVDDRDAAILAAHWSGDVGESGAAPIPEPAATVAILAGALLLLAKTWRKPARRNPGPGWKVVIGEDLP